MEEFVRDVTLNDLVWRTGSPTDKTCSFLYGGCEHFFELRLNFQPYAYKLRSVPVVHGRGLLCLPRAQFEQMRKLALWVMRANKEIRAWVREDHEQKILRPLEEYTATRQRRMELT